MLKYLGPDAEVSERRMKYARVERERRFLLRGLPEGLAPADFHFQLFDNYVTGTRLRLRKVRDPRAREWTWKLTQKIAADASNPSRTVITNLYLSREEYEVLSVFEANEIRKNRYPFEHAGRAYSVDVFLGDLRGLILAETGFASDEEMRALEPPPFSALEVTGDEMFTGGRLVHLTADELRAELARRG
jgi:CYTH domain-containing protein